MASVIINIARRIFRRLPKKFGSSSSIIYSRNYGAIRRPGLWCVFGGGGLVYRLSTTPKEATSYPVVVDFISTVGVHLARDRGAEVWFILHGVVMHITSPINCYADNWLVEYTTPIYVRDSAAWFARN